MWARFDEDGCAAWFGPEPVTNSVLLDLKPLEQLLEQMSLEEILTTYRRSVENTWEPRPPVVVPKLSPEQIAAAREVEYLTAKVNVEVTRLEAYRQVADPLFFKWQAGEATKEEWLSSREKVRLDYPLLDKPKEL